jgi:hypothetical protein
MWNVQEADEHFEFGEPDHPLALFHCHVAPTLRPDQFRAGRNGDMLGTACGQQQLSKGAVALLKRDCELRHAFPQVSLLAR